MDPIRNLQAQARPRANGDKIELGHQTVIAGGRFKTDAVVGHLDRQKPKQDFPPPRHPPVARGAAEKPAGHAEGRRIRRQVISVAAEDFEVALDEHGVLVEGAQEPQPVCVVTPRGRALEDVEEPGPGKDPHGGFHGGGPVGAPGVGIFPDPALDHRPDGGGVFVVAIQKVSLADGDQPLQPREFPRQLDIGDAAPIQNVNVPKEADRPGNVVSDVPLPVDLPAEPDRSRAQEIYLMAAGPGGQFPDSRRVAGAEFLVVRGIDPAGPRGMGIPGKPFNQGGEARLSKQPGEPRPIGVRRGRTAPAFRLRRPLVAQTAGDLARRPPESAA